MLPALPVRYVLMVFLPVLAWLAVPAAMAAACPDLQPAPVSVHCGRAPSAVFDSTGRLWVAFVKQQHVYVARSTDLGQTFSAPVPVNLIAEDIEYNGENRPKLLLASDDILLLSWTTRTSAKFTGEIRFSRSTDGGKHFAAPRTVNDDQLLTGHRFDSLYMTPSGLLYLVWLDKRDREASLARQETYVGAAVYYAVSTDNGAHFSPNYRVANNSCECCRIAVAAAGADGLSIMWRQVFEGSVRDHAITTLTPTGAVAMFQRATVDRWQTDACPHHGPALLAGGAGQYHMAWFSNGLDHRGIYYARFDFDSGRSDQIHLVDGRPGAAHPWLAAAGSRLYLVWKGFNGDATQIQLITSDNQGRSWSMPSTLLTTEQGSDHPLLVSDGSRVYLSWWTQALGYVFQALPSE